MLIYEFDKIGCIVLARKRIGIIAVGQQKHADVEPFFQQQVNTPDGCFNSGRVTIVEHRYIFGKAVNKSYLTRRKRCARRCHHILDATLMHGDNVGITLHQKTPVVFNDGLFGKINSV